MSEGFFFEGFLCGESEEGDEKRDFYYVELSVIFLLDFLILTFLYKLSFHLNYDFIKYFIDKNYVITILSNIKFYFY